jgi:hypothetical protein
MAENDDVLAELRHRIMGPFESGRLKPARPQKPMRFCAASACSLGVTSVYDILASAPARTRVPGAASNSSRARRILFLQSPRDVDARGWGASNYMGAVFISSFDDVGRPA